MWRLWPNSKTIILWIVGCAFFMEMLDSTALNTAVPQIALSLDINPIKLKMALTSYLLSLGVFIPVSGWMADRFGTRTIFSLAMMTFLAGSISCGFSNSLTMLVLSRIVQGIGGAMMSPVGRLILLRSYPKSQLVHVTSRITMVTLIAPTLGPMIGGAITTYLSWRFIFFINIPIGLLGIYCIRKFIQNEKFNHDKHFDLFGFLLLGISLAGVLVGLNTITDSDISVNVSYLIVGISTAMFVLYFIYAKRVKEAIVDVSIFNVQSFKLTTIGMTLFRISTGGVPFLLPLMLQLEFGYSAIHSGLLTSPLALGMLVMKSQVKPILHRFGFKKVLVCNSVFVGILLMQLNWIALGLPAWNIIIIVFLYGLALSIQFSAMNVLSYSQIPESKLSTGSSVISANQQISTCFGVAIAALFLEHYLQSRDISTLFSVQAFRYTFLSIGSISIFSSLLFYLLPNGIAENVAKGSTEPKPV